MVKVETGQIRLDIKEHLGSEGRRYIVGKMDRNGDFHIRWPDDSDTKGIWTQISFKAEELEEDPLDPEYVFYKELEDI